MKKILKTFWNCIVRNKHFRYEQYSNWNGTYSQRCVDCGKILGTYKNQKNEE